VMRMSFDLDVGILVIRMARRHRPP